MLTESLFDLYDLGTGVTALSVRRGDAASSAGPYGGFNACHYTGDDPRHVVTCRQNLCSCLNLEPSRLVIPRQTHSLNVAVVTGADAGNAFEDVDALVTCEEGIALAVNTADCVPLLLADPVNRVVAAVHSGWRGTVGDIAVRALEAMCSCGADLSAVRAVTGPSICPECFEVGDEVAERFAGRWQGRGVVIGRSPVTGKFHVDLRRAIRLSLEDAGVPGAAIDDMSAPCSRCNSDIYFSARRSGINSGRTLSLVMLSDRK